MGGYMITATDINFCGGAMGDICALKDGSQRGIVQAGKGQRGRGGCVH